MLRDSWTGIIIAAGVEWIQVTSVEDVVTSACKSIGRSIADKRASFFTSARAPSKQPSKLRSSWRAFLHPIPPSSRSRQQV